LIEISELSRKIALAVAKVAIKQNLALQLSDEALKAKIDANFWHAEYRQYKRVSV
jgi:malate dehydrogenase (oxaloacetate-decarboxylating)